ncbi:hypothetical protein RUM43_013385 [Polyplax serrata]|uniref:Uncharacterized protein n=1 Tax=Polyplax serrata TaxID=468196 RepID=A0AAN8P0K8_POLSC
MENTFYPVSLCLAVIRVGGVRIGGFDRQHKTNFTGRLGAGVQIGGRDTLKTKELSKELSGKSEIGNSERNRSTATEAGASTGVKVFKLRLLLPYKSFGFREYNKATSSALNSLKRGSAKKLDFFKRYDIETQIETLTMTPSPIRSRVQPPLPSIPYFISEPYTAHNN